MTSINFFVHGTPQGKGSMRSFPSKTTGKMVSMQTLAGSVPWAQAVKCEAMKVRPSGWQWQYDDTAFDLKVICYFQRPKGHFKKNGTLKPSAPKFPITKSTHDHDKLLRNISDALSGILYRDDSQVCDSQMKKRYADGKPIGAEITVEELCST